MRSANCPYVLSSWDSLNPTHRSAPSLLLALPQIIGSGKTGQMALFAYRQCTKQPPSTVLGAEVRQKSHWIAQPAVRLSSKTAWCAAPRLSLVGFSPTKIDETPCQHWAGRQFRISQGWLHCYLQQAQYLFLLWCWCAVLVKLGTVYGDSVASDLSQAIDHTAKCPTPLLSLPIICEQGC